MTYTVEVMLRETHRVVAQDLDHPAEPSAWTDVDVVAVLRSMLRVADRLQNPDGDDDRPVALRGVSWIVTPHGEGSAIAMEIFSGTIVAGPFAIAEPALDKMIARVMAADRAAGQVVH